MATNERSVELAGINLTGQNHVCAFFNTMDEEHRVLRSFYKVVSSVVKRLRTSWIPIQTIETRAYLFRVIGIPHHRGRKKALHLVMASGPKMLHSVEYQRRYYN